MTPEDERQLVADDRGRGAQAAQQRVLVEARPAGHHQADDAQAADREEVEQPQLHLAADHARREGDDEQRHDRGEVDDRRREREDGHVHAGGREVLLGEHLEPVDRRRAACPTGRRGSGPRRRFTNAMIFISKKMITKAAGTVNRRIAGRRDEEAEDVDVRLAGVQREGRRARARCPVTQTTVKADAARGRAARGAAG